MKITVTTATADRMRAAAPKLGIATVSQDREIVGPGLEAFELHPMTAAAFMAKVKAAKVSPDVMIRRILTKVGA